MLAADALAAHTHVGEQDDHEENSEDDVDDHLSPSGFETTIVSSPRASPVSPPVSTVVRPEASARALEAVMRWSAARGLAPSSTPTASRVKRTIRMIARA